MKKNFIFAIITICIWSTSPAIVKLLIADVPNMQALSIGGFIAFAFLLITNICTGKLKLIKNYHFKDISIMCGLGFIGLFLYDAFYYKGIELLTSQEACIINYLWPIMIVVFSSIILKEKMTLKKIIALVLSLLGVVVMMMDSNAKSGENQILGILVCIGAALCYGLFSVLNKKTKYDQNIAMMFLWLTVGICSLIVGLVTETWVPIKGTGWLGFIWLGAFINGIGYLLWAMAINAAKNTAAIANLAYLTPFLSILFSSIVLKEKITINALIALVFIIGGILLQQIQFGKNKKSNVR